METGRKIVGCVGETIRGEDHSANNESKVRGGRTNIGPERGNV
jgi:hypothetical protein